MEVTNTFKTKHYDINNDEAVKIIIKTLLEKYGLQFI